MELKDQVIYPFRWGSKVHGYGEWNGSTTNPKPHIPVSAVVELLKFWGPEDKPDWLESILAELRALSPQTEDAK